MPQQIVRAISVSVGDEIELVGGVHAGRRARVTSKRPKTALYATHIKIQCDKGLQHFRNKWIPVKWWRKVI